MASPAIPVADPEEPEFPVAPPAGRFDPEDLEASTGKGWLVELFLSYPHRFLGFLRFLGPVRWLPILGGAYFVLRYDEVREVLDHDREFPVPWNYKMLELTRGKNFVLGMARDEQYRRSYRNLAEAFRIEDVAAHVESESATQARLIVNKVAGGGARFDVVEQLIMEVPARICRSYYGLRIGDEETARFAKASLAVSSFIFNPTDDEESRRLGVAAAAVLSKVIRESIAHAKLQKPQDRAAAMGQLLDVQDRLAGKPSEERIDDETLHAYLFGMVLGFVPTDILAGGNMIETLLRRPDFMERAREAAVDNDDELLWRCLREALRFRHINPGPIRRCADGYTLNRGGPGEYHIPAGSRVLACTQSAMFDPRRIERPHVFDPGRREEDYMIFGVGQHWCIGAYIAKAQITQTLKPLLQRPGLKAAANRRVRTKRFNDIYPLHLPVEFLP